MDTASVSHSSEEKGRDYLDNVSRPIPSEVVEGASRRIRFLTIPELRQQPPTEWRVLRVIPARGLIVLWGAPGSGKTFIALSLAADVVRGVPWAGRRTKAGAVAYVAAEGTLRDRVDAYLKHHRLTDADLERFHVLEATVNLRESVVGIEVLLAELHAVAERCGGVALVVIDTLNRAMAGGDENSSRDMGAMIAAAKRIETELACAVVYIHHSGKDASVGGRGHSSLKAASDTEISVTCNSRVRKVRLEKCRDGEDGVTLMTFRLEKIDLGPASEFDHEAEQDERRTSCVVVPVDAALPSGGGAKLTDLDQLALRELKALYGAFADQRTVMAPKHAHASPAVDIDAWREAFRRARGVDIHDKTAMDTSKKAFQRSQERLVQQGLVTVRGADAWLL